jgi:Ser/Thr protein kinase RdoA (MazF antagonist)
MPPDWLYGIGVIGTGVQARLQVQQLKSLYPKCRKLTVWGRTKENTEKYAKEMMDEGWDVTIAATPKAVAEHSNLIITTTTSKVALLDENDITEPNTLIIAIGADMPGKLELSANLLKDAQSIIIDSIEQGKNHGNAAEALKNGIIQETDLQELGDLLKNGLNNPEKGNMLRIFLSSGIGVQDLQIVQSVIAGYNLKKEEVVDEVPDFDNEKIANIVMELYGIEGEISPLNAFEDQNALIKTASGSFVIKISNKKILFEDLNGQNLLLEHLKKSAPELNCPEVVLTKTGNSISMVAGFAVRMLTYIEGNVLGGSVRSLELDYSIGQYLGRFSNAVQSFKHPVLEKPNDYWNLDNALACKTFVRDVDDEQTRVLINRFYEHYENNVVPKVSELRQGVIHGDANEQNFLVSKGTPSEVTGLIDLGDMQWATHINDLAIAMAYALLDVKDIESTAREIVNGYNKEFPIQNAEFEVLSDLVVMRLITSIVLTSNRAKKYPENTYIICSQEPAINLLKKLEKLEFKVPFGYPAFE